MPSRSIRDNRMGMMGGGQVRPQVGIGGRPVLPQVAAQPTPSSAQIGAAMQAQNQRAIAPRITQPAIATTGAGPTPVAQPAVQPRPVMNTQPVMGRGRI